MSPLKRLVISFVVAAVLYMGNMTMGALVGTTQDSWDAYCAGDYAGKGRTCEYWDARIAAEWGWEFGPYYGIGFLTATFFLIGIGVSRLPPLPEEDNQLRG